MMTTSKNVRDLLEIAFKKVDHDKSGFLEKKELEEILRSLTRYLGLDDPSSEDVADVLR
jgi:Ca2+-binding EF-hand superfamily protein